MTKADKKRHSFVYKNFNGVDYAHAPANVSARRSVDGINMVRSEVGKVQKRTGYEYEEKQWKKGINGIHFYRKGGRVLRIVHSGTGFYLGDVLLYSDAADNKSRSLQINENLVILDGENFLFFDGQEIHRVKDYAYVPTVCVDRLPSGGGKDFEQANILTDMRKEGFISDGESREYVLSRAGLDSDTVTAVVYNDDGTVEYFSTGDGLKVDTSEGVVTFTSAPRQTKYAESNVYITYSKAAAGFSRALEKCTVMALYGPGGRPDTLFISGNPNHPGREWFSAEGNIFFFGEKGTDAAGNAPVKGYSTRGNKLFVHRQGAGENMNILVRKCSGTDEYTNTYPVENILTGPAATAEDSFVNMANDALFLTEKGVYAIAESEADERHFLQQRSFYINPSLLSKNGLADAQAVEFDDFYVLAVGKDIYLLDTLQKSHEEDKEYSHWQYECYHWQIPDEIKLLFVEDGRLCFATDEGRIGRFYKDYTLPENYNDGGRAIKAVWQSCDFTGEVPQLNKNIHRMWIVMATAQRTGVRAEAQVKGIWKELFTDNTTGRFFRWRGLCWSKFTWSNDKTSKLVSRSIRIRNIDRMAIRLENETLNEPFGIYEIGFDYTEGSYYR